MIQFHSGLFLRRATISGGSGYVSITEQQSSVDLERDNILCSNTFMSSDAVSMASSLCTKMRSLLVLSISIAINMVS